MENDLVTGQRLHEDAFAKDHEPAGQAVHTVAPYGAKDPALPREELSWNWVEQHDENIKKITSVAKISRGNRAW